jgi:hypothetical protein
MKTHGVNSEFTGTIVGRPQTGRILPVKPARKCRTCGRDYVHYRGRGIPSGFCSGECRAAAPRPPIQEKMPPPLPPADIVEAMHVHRLKMHQTTSLMPWFDSCSTCQQYEDWLAESAGYHLAVA